MPSLLSNEALLTQWPHDDALLHETRKRTGDTILLGFSRGKDSIAAWIKLRDSGLFKRIIPVFMYLIPDLKFEEESLQYFEDCFHTHIYRVPHTALYNMLANNIWQPPGHLWRNADYMERLTCTVPELNTYIKESLGLPAGTLMANGVRAMDTPLRRMGIHRHGPFGADNVKIIWNYSTKDVMDSLKRNNIELPIDYQLFGRSFDGINIQYLYPIYRHFPEDYKKICEWFPLAELEIMRFTTLEDKSDDWILKNGRYVANYEKFKNN